MDLKIRLIQAAIDCISVEYCCEFFYGADVYFGDSASLGRYPSAVLHVCTLIILLNIEYSPFVHTVPSHTAYPTAIPLYLVMPVASMTIHRLAITASGVPQRIHW